MNHYCFAGIFLVLKSIIDAADGELARVLGFGETEWNDIRNRIPLSDIHIAEVTRELENNRSLRVIGRSIKKARHEARKKLEGVKNKWDHLNT